MSTIYVTFEQRQDIIAISNNNELLLSERDKHFDIIVNDKHETITFPVIDKDDIKILLRCVKKHDIKSFIKEFVRIINENASISNKSRIKGMIDDVLAFDKEDACLYLNTDYEFSLDYGDLYDLAELFKKD